MNSQLRFEKREIKRGKTGAVSSVPDLIGGLILQNELDFDLEEEDEIYEAYGRAVNSYPYCQRNTYSRELEMQSMKVAVLENDFLRAEFLPELGGRLWVLWDKRREKNLLYTNDVIRYSNLAVRNAWFSGGVEWNAGVIGHTPFTTEPLFTATLTRKTGVPVLRMYEYERVRQVTYQMDFWLEDTDEFLNARMRIVNFNREVVPMYWWSNIAVPEYKNGRIIVPACKAYTNKHKRVYKVAIPMVDGVDVTRYENTPDSVDYFFEIEKEDPKYIVNIDQDGYGLLQMSTSRLQARKLFSWGHKKASAHWQEWLTENAGPYVEIQAGLSKTQYGCIPMAPHTAWEWLERYGAVNIGQDQLERSFEELRDSFTETLKGRSAYTEMEQVLKETKQMALEPAKLRLTGSGYGALKSYEQRMSGKKEISTHLDFGMVFGGQKIWADFLKTGVLEKPDAMSAPPDFMVDEVYFQMLKESIKKGSNHHWYALYQLALFYFQKGKYKKAELAFEQANLMEESPWVYHGLASLYTVTEQKKQAVRAAVHGLELRNTDLSFVKATFRILLLNDGYAELIGQYGKLPEENQEESRIVYDYIIALAETGKAQQAYELLCRDGGLEVDDIREGETIGDIWKKLHKEIYGGDAAVPYAFDFTTAG